MLDSQSKNKVPNITDNITGICKYVKLLDFERVEECNDFTIINVYFCIYVCTTTVYVYTLEGMLRFIISSVVSGSGLGIVYTFKF